MAGYRKSVGHAVCDRPRSASVPQNLSINLFRQLR
jgi:hypothetical protein